MVDAFIPILRPYVIYSHKWIAGVRFTYIYRIFEDDVVLVRLTDEQLEQKA